MLKPAMAAQYITKLLLQYIINLQMLCINTSFSIITVQQSSNISWNGLVSVHKKPIYGLQCLLYTDSFTDLLHTAQCPFRARGPENYQLTFGSLSQENTI